MITSLSQSPEFLFLLLFSYTINLSIYRNATFPFFLSSNILGMFSPRFSNVLCEKSFRNKTFLGFFFRAILKMFSFTFQDCIFAMIGRVLGVEADSTWLPCPFLLWGRGCTFFPTLWALSIATSFCIPSSFFISVLTINSVSSHEFSPSSSGTPSSLILFRLE